METLIESRAGRHLSLHPARGSWVGSALVLHGGKSQSHEPVTPFQLAVLRISLLTRAVHRQVAGHGVGVWFLRFGQRGWNDAEASPLADVRWALDQIRDRSEGRPVVLVGHSMGGRAAVRAAGDPSVRGVVGLAPWLPAGEPVAQLAGRRLLIGHGTADRITDPADSRRYAERARGVASSVELAEIPGETHALLRQAATWNRLAARGVLEGLAPR